jgi:S1-C subfamily serine protease
MAGWERARRVVLAAIILSIAACDPGMPVSRVPLSDTYHMDPGAVLAPLRFDRISFNLRRGDRIGAYRDGLDCAYSVGDGDGIWWNSGRLISQDIEWSDLFFEQLQASGYTVLGDPDSLFPEADRRRAAYRVRAAVEEVRVNLCEVVDILTRVHLGAQYGKASVRVYWQVYSPTLRKVVLESRSQGYDDVDRPLPNAVETLLAEAFSQAAANFAADPALIDLVHRPRPTREDVLRAKVGPHRWLPYLPAFDTPFADHAEDIRYSVVSLDNGEGHGSGVFIAPHLILTNQHVVEGTHLVRVRLVTGRETIGDVIAYHDQRDVALVQVEPAGYRPLPLRLTPVRVGEDVYAIGNPLSLGLRSTVSKGVISRFSQNDAGLPDIQADVDIHGGNSGGPLLDDRGNVIGLAYAGYRAAADSPTGVGLNFFVPIAGALDALDLRVRDPNDTRVAEDAE